MGHRVKKDIVSVQKERLKTLFNSFLETTKDILRFQLTLTNKENELKGIKKLIKDCEKAQNIIASIQHIEILISLYNSFIAQKESYYVLLSTTINAKNTIVKWDRTEKGFQEFLKLDSEAKAKSKQEYEERMKQQEIVRKAKEDGKKVEFAFKNGKLEPIIVSEKPN